MVPSPGGIVIQSSKLPPQTPTPSFGVPPDREELLQKIHQYESGARLQPRTAGNVDVTELSMEECTALLDAPNGVCFIVQLKTYDPIAYAPILLAGPDALGVCLFFFPKQEDRGTCCVACGGTCTTPRPGCARAATHTK